MLAYLGALNPYLATFLASIIPVLETQAAVPLGVLTYKLDPWVIVGISMLAGMFIPALLLPIFGWLVNSVASMHPQAKHWVDTFLATRKARHTKDFERWGTVALAMFIAIPGPFTGAWSASILAYLFGIRYGNAILSIGIGSGLASIVVLLLVLGGRQLLGQL